MERLFVRAKYLLRFNKTGKLERIRDGYILTEGRSIKETGAFTVEIGKRFISGYSGNLKILGTKAIKNQLSYEDLIINNGILLPGFVKAHGHDHESPIIGLVKDQPLTKWLDGIVNVYSGFLHGKKNELTKYFNKTPQYITYLKAKLDDIYYGITASMTHHCNHNKYHAEDLRDACRTAGTKIIIAIGGQDRNYFREILDIPLSKALERLNEYEKTLDNNDTCRIIPGPDQIFSNSEEMLIALKKWASERNKFIHIHSSEEYNTTEWFKKKYGSTEVEFAKRIGFLDENTILAHQVQTTERDLEILAETGTRIVHNPLANTILGSGMPPVVEMLKKGIKVAIATDGSGSADNQNILNAARLAAQYQKALHKDATLLDSETLLKMITLIPAQILKLPCGNIEEGLDADFILADLNRPNLNPTRLESVVENLLWASDGSEISSVVSMGKILMEEKKILAFESEKLLEEVNELCARFDDYKKNLPEFRGTGANE